MALLTDSVYALLASRVRSWLGGKFLEGPVPCIMSGTVYIGLGLSTALADRS